MSTVYTLGDRLAAASKSAVTRTGDGDPFSSKEELGWESFNPTGQTGPVETGDELPLDGFESAEPEASEPTTDNTEVGDWLLSCSETDKLGDADLPEISAEWANLRG